MFSFLSSLLGFSTTPPAAAPPPAKTASAPPSTTTGANPYPGLENRTGNDCWANALMQLIASVPSLQAMLTELGDLLEANGDTPDKREQGTILKRELKQLVRDRVSRARVSTADTKNIRHALSVILSPLPGSEGRIIEDSARQEDAHEALNALITLHETMKKAAGTFTEREPGRFPLKVTRHYREIEGPSRAPSPAFRSGSTTEVRVSAEDRIRLTCRDPADSDAYSVLGPENTSARTDTEIFCKIEISADMERRLHEYRLASPRLTAADRKSREQQLFTGYIQSYFDSGLPASSEAGYYFNQDDRMMHAYKPYKETKRISAPPSEFILLIPRFSPDRRKYKHENPGGSRTEIQVPLQERFTLPSEYVGENATYEVDGFVRHMGDTGGGHYISYQKLNGIWYEFNDKNVREIPADELKVAMEEGYFFHYRKLDKVDTRAFAVPALAGEPPAMIERPAPAAVVRPSTACATPTLAHSLGLSLDIARRQKDVAALCKWADAFKRGDYSFTNLPKEYLHKLHGMVWVRDNLSALHPGVYGEVICRENPTTILDPCGPLIFSEGANLLEQLVAKETAEVEQMLAEKNLVELNEFNNSFKNPESANKLAQYTRYTNLDSTLQLRIETKLAQKEGKKTAEKELYGRGDFGREELDKNILILSQVYNLRTLIQEIFPGQSLEKLTASSPDQQAALQHLIDLLATGSSDAVAIQGAFDALEEDLKNKIRGLVYFEHIARRAFAIAHSILLNNIGKITTGTLSILAEVIEENENIKCCQEVILAEKKAAHRKAVSEYTAFSPEQKKEIQTRMGL